jgi:predicted lipoprotein
MTRMLAGDQKLACFALAATAFCASASIARAEADHAAIARAALTEVIRPGYAAFDDATSALSAKFDALCKQPSAAALKEAKSAFAAAVDAWSKVEIFRFGPVVENHRFDRLFYWPDPKSLGLKQIQDALARNDETVIAADSLAGKSVALQGLPALEYLLYGDGGAALAKGEGEAAFRCKFAANVAANTAKTSAVIAAGWADGAPFAKAFLNPTPADAAYHAPKEVSLELFKAFASGIELVRDQKIGKPLGAKPEEAKPKLAAFWRSGLTFPNMIGNLEGVRLLFAKGGFAEVVKSDSPGVENSILFDLDHAIAVLKGIDEPFAEAATAAETRAKLEALRVGLKSAGQTGGDIIGRSAGLSFGFNAMDGD